MGRRGRYSKEFKLEAIRLIEEGEKPSTQIALELGVKRTLIYRWKAELSARGNKAFNRSSGRPKNENLDELTRLRQENQALKEERDILKKAAAYFAKDLK